MTHRFDDFSQYHFKEQHENEKILAVLHRHWFDIFVNYAIVIVIVVLQIASVPFFEAMLGGAVTRAEWFSFLLFQSVVLMFLWFYGFMVWIDYWFDVWIVTNERVVNIEQKGLFSRSVSELYYRSVQDVTSTVEGVVPTLLNYGDVEVQTAAENVRFIFRHVPNPYDVKAMILEHARHAQHAHVQEMKNTIPL